MTSKVIQGDIRPHIMPNHSIDLCSYGQLLSLFEIILAINIFS